MSRRSVSISRRLMLGISSFVILAVMYTVVSNWKYSQNPKQSSIPGWSELFRGVQKVLAPNEFDYDGKSLLLVDSMATFSRLATGIGIGCFGGVVIGVLMGCYSSFEALLLPPISFLAKIPLTAMLPVFFALFGVDFDFYVGMIAFGVLPSLAQSTFQSVRKDVPDELIYKASTLGASHFEVIWNVIYRQVLPRIIDSIRLQIGPAMVYLIAAEWINAYEGFGFRLRFESKINHMNVVYVYLVYLGLIGLLIDVSLTWLRRKLCPWFGE